MIAIGNNLIVEIIKEESKGLVTFEVKKPYAKAKVISIGDKVESKNLSVGCEIYFNADSLKFCIDEDTNIYVIGDKSILCVC